MPNGKAAPSESSTVHRSLDLLEAVAGAKRAIGLSELAVSVGGSKATAHRLLSTLESRGYVTQAPSGGYSPGLRLFELGSLWAQSLDLRFLAAPHMDRLNEATGEMVHLAVYDQGDAVYIDKRDSRHPVVPQSHVGRRCDAYCVATGRVLLAYQPVEEIEEALRPPLTEHTEHTISDPKALADLLAEVRANGYAVNHESFREGVSGIAAPVRDHTGSVVAAIGCCMPEARFGPEQLADLRDHTVAAAEAVSGDLGARIADRLQANASEAMA